jgi:hypothetical protein
MSDPKLDWITRIDQARGVITLAVSVLIGDQGPHDAYTACALDLANQELQRLRDEIDANWAASRQKTS